MICSVIVGVDYGGVVVLCFPCGVPQGSVLGPLLFILYSNDIPNSLKYSKSILFADDTTVYISENVTDLLRCLNHDLSKLNDWFKASKLSLNVNKTNYILFNKKYSRITTRRMPLYRHR